MKKAGIIPKIEITDEKLYYGENLTKFSKLTGLVIVGLISALYALYILLNIFKIIKTVGKGATEIYILTLVIILNFCVLVVGVVIVSNELGKLIGFIEQKVETRNLIKGAVIIIFSLFFGFVINFYIQYKTESSSVAIFQDLVFPWFFHWVGLMLIGFIGYGSATSYVELRIENESKYIYLIRKSRIGKGPINFKIKFSDFDMILVTGPGKSPATSKSFYIYLYLMKKNADGTLENILESDEYLFGNRKKVTCKVLEGIASLYNFHWGVMKLDGKLKMVQFSSIEAGCTT